MTRISIQPEGHEVEYSNGSIEYVGEYDITLAFDRGERWNLRLTYGSYVIDVKPLSFTIESDSSGEYGHLHHLDVPTSLRNQGFGKLCIAIFYAVLDDEGVTQFSMKFGGGQASRKFLESMGFSPSIVHTAQDADFSGQSVMVGDFVSTGDGDREWVLYPTPLSKFPQIV